VKTLAQMITVLEDDRDTLGSVMEVADVSVDERNEVLGHLNDAIGILQEQS